MRAERSPASKVQYPFTAFARFAPDPEPVVNSYARD